MGLRQMSQGSSVNTWGDDKLNEVMRVIDRSTKGVQSLAITGETTLSWTNYVATNDGQVAALALTGSLSSPANLVMPSREWTFDLVKNSTGQTITLKTAAGTGVAIPNGRQAQIYCDGVDCYNGSPTLFPTSDITITGKISGLTAGTASTDAVNKNQMEAAIAVLLGTSVSGLVLNSMSDLAADYLTNKITASGSLVKTTTNAGTVNEATDISFTFDEGLTGLFAETFA